MSYKHKAVIKQLLESVKKIYYKMRHVLQSGIDCITKSVRYYKVWQLLESKI